jgi:hypothetical protein
MREGGVLEHHDAVDLDIRILQAGSALCQLAPGFDPRTDGHKRLSRLVTH